MAFFQIESQTFFPFKYNVIKLNLDYFNYDNFLYKIYLHTKKSKVKIFGKLIFCFGGIILKKKSIIQLVLKIITNIFS